MKTPHGRTWYSAWHRKGTQAVLDCLLALEVSVSLPHMDTGGWDVKIETAGLQ